MNIKDREKSKYKEKIGTKLIKDNKLLCQEFFFWCQIFNEYKPKLPLFYDHAKSYKNIFTEILNNLQAIQNKIQIDREKFLIKISRVVFKYTSDLDFKEICKKILYN